MTGTDAPSPVQPAELHTEGHAELPLETKQAIYRIMQEALANVARHSAAEHVELALCYQDQGVEFRIRDDGNGFDPQAQYNGMGLDSMRARAEGLGGTYEITSEAELGTQILVKFPYPREREE